MPEGQTVAHKRQAFVGSVEASAYPSSDNDPDGGKDDPAAVSRRYDLEREIDQKIDRYRKEGKDPNDLFNPSKPDYLGKSDVMLPYANGPLVHLATDTDGGATPISSPGDMQSAQLVPFLARPPMFFGRPPNIIRPPTPAERAPNAPEPTPNPPATHQPVLHNSKRQSRGRVANFRDPQKELLISPDEKA
jgi:hypothetical protein